jgi:hypothetical protein
LISRKRGLSLSPHSPELNLADLFKGEYFKVKRKCLRRPSLRDTGTAKGNIRREAMKLNSMI